MPTNIPQKNRLRQPAHLATAAFASLPLIALAVAFMIAAHASVGAYDLAVSPLF